MPEEPDTTAEATEVKSDTRLRFVLTIEGDGETGTIKAEAWKYDNDGGLVEAAAVKERDAENIVVALYDGGLFYQTVSLLLGRSMAVGAGDFARAVQIDFIAKELGLRLPPLVDGSSDAPPADDAAVQSTFAGTIAEALAGE